jgi:hypothetical protein
LGEPSWRDDGKEISFESLNYSILSVEVSAGAASFQPGSQCVFVAPADSQGVMTGNGKRFLASVPLGQTRQPVATPITVVLNWPWI